MSKTGQKHRKALDKVSTGQYTITSSLQMNKQSFKKSQNRDKRVSSKVNNDIVVSKASSIDISQFDSQIDSLGFQPILAQQFRNMNFTNPNNDLERNSLCYINNILNKQSISDINWQKDKDIKNSRLISKQNEQLRRKVQQFRQRIRELQLLVDKLTIELEKSQKKAYPQEKNQQKKLKILSQQISQKQEQIKKLKQENCNLKIDLATRKKESKQKDKQIMNLLDKIHEVGNQVRQSRQNTPVKKRSPDQNNKDTLTNKYQRRVIGLQKQSSKFDSQMHSRQERVAMISSKIQQKRSFLIANDKNCDSRSKASSRSSSKIAQSKSDKINNSQYIAMSRTEKLKKVHDNKCQGRTGSRDTDPSYKKSQQKQAINQQSPVRTSKYFLGQRQSNAYFPSRQNKRSPPNRFDKDINRTPSKLLGIEPGDQMNSSHASTKRSTYQYKKSGFSNLKSDYEKERQADGSPKIHSKIGALEAQMSKQINLLRRSKR